MDNIIHEKHTEKEKRLIGAIILTAYYDLISDLKNNKTSKGFSLVERGRFRGNSIKFFYSPYFKLYCFLLDKPYKDYKFRIQSLINSSDKEFKRFLKNKNNIDK